MDKAAEGLLNEPNDSYDEAALRLHNSDAKRIADELGVEVWDGISGDDHSVYMVSTGYDNEYAVGAVSPYGKIDQGSIKYKDAVWHTHPRGSRASLNDLATILDKGGHSICASGKRLSRFKNPNFSKPQGLQLNNETIYTDNFYSGGRWKSYQRQYNN